MDIIATLRAKIDQAGAGDHTLGLMALLAHVEVAYKHLKRGQKNSDDSAFTDAVYRTNQAFEGGLKEAYGVLAKKKLDKTRIFDIEQFFSKSNVFRKRVLDQFTNYRQEWRNPSTHDHKLDFSESEAFLAIVSVTAFSCLLVDEIALQLARDREEEAAKLLTQTIKSKFNFADGDLLGRVTEALKSYFTLRSVEELESNSYSQWLGSVAGFLSAIFPDAEVLSEAQIGGEKRKLIADVLVKSSDQSVVVEIKNRVNIHTYESMLIQLESVIASSGHRDGIVFYLPTMVTSGQVFELDRLFNDGEGRLKVLSAVPLKTRLE
ncbi:hypothetical protein ALP25_05495 [Pseudomonas syringae pv. syringae]|uniref:hypothetical protein n=1 Tax=Pseudomonas TaxID=286 RepID=UPI000F00AB3B|nr:MULTISPECIES: hypothetical protein [Pseudomonas]RMU66446.1 hypothetical protein ALP25_05495 [Pseudomonas syringae pv. syringae]